MSYRYYDKNAEKFRISIQNADVTKIITHFCSFISPNSKILEAGCGTGRDLKCFIEKGYEMYAFDASQKMAQIASEFTGLQVKVAMFENVDYPDEFFDAIWANASLLHVKRSDMESVYEKLYRFLKPGGILYVSYKIRDKDFNDGERFFTCYTEDRFRSFIENTKFKLKEVEITNDSRPGRDEEKWLNCILQKLNY